VSAPPPGDPLIGQVIDDRYRILRVIGLGGMGVVYEAEATRLGSRRCAVKVLLPEYTRNENAVARFAREAQVAARVKHPNVVEIFDTGTTQDGLGYIAMELLQGETLDSALDRDGPLPWPRAQRIILQVCRALAAAHAEGIVHRDMKPENCFLCSRDDDADFIKVLDFGIAKLTTPEAGRLTVTNSVIGTYSYMAYEQICGEEVDHRVDVWATGVILYELLTGQLPFNGNNPGQIWRAITENDPALMRSLAPQAGIPEALEPIVRQAMARSLADRYPSIQAFARALASIPADGSVRSVTGKLAAGTRHDATAATPVSRPEW
jgi:serine/threonine protein kinase